MTQEDLWPFRLQRELLQALKNTSGVEWGYDEANNLGMEADFREAFDAMPGERLRLQHMEVTEKGIEIQVTVGAELTSLPEISKAMYELLYAVGENLFLVVLLLDDEAV